MPISIDSKNVEWEAPPEGHYLTDVKQKVLWIDEETGATIALLKFPVGVEGEGHVHPEANQYNYGLSGEVERPDGSRVSIEGKLNIVPKGERHGNANFTKESISLFFWDGPPTREE